MSKVTVKSNQEKPLSARNKRRMKSEFKNDSKISLLTIFILSAFTILTLAIIFL